MCGSCPSLTGNGVLVLFTFLLSTSMVMRNALCYIVFYHLCHPDKLFNSSSQQTSTILCHLSVVKQYGTQRSPSSRGQLVTGFPWAIRHIVLFMCRQWQWLSEDAGFGKIEDTQRQITAIWQVMGLIILKGYWSLNEGKAFVEKSHILWKGSRSKLFSSRIYWAKKANSNSWCTLNNTVCEITVSAQWEAQDKRQLSVRRNLGKDIIIPSSKGKISLLIFIAK